MDTSPGCRYWLGSLPSGAHQTGPPTTRWTTQTGIQVTSRGRSVITPSISDLAVEFGVARTTIQKATESLRDERVIQTSPMGMFVSG